MKKSGCVILVLFVAVCVSMFANLILFAAFTGSRSASRLTGVKALKPREFEEVIQKEGSSRDKIAVIPLNGVISNSGAGDLGDNMVQDFKLALQQAQDDPTVRAVIISVDSPGGEITASDVLYNSLKEFSKHKPSIVYFNSLGASGAYYTACGANYIMCNATTFTGSIGVIIETMNYKDLFGKIGLQSVVFKSGQFKDMLNGARDMTPEEKTYVQGLVMQSYGRFVGIVAKARHLDEATLRNGIADGRILSGTDALQAHLVDELGYIEDAYTKAQQLAGAPDAEVVSYERGLRFANFLKIFGQAKAPDIKLDLLSEAPHLEAGRVYLLPFYFAQ